MKHLNRWMAVMVCLAWLGLTGCKGTAVATAEEDVTPAKVEHLQGDEPTRVTLTEDAAKRLDLQTSVVQSMVANGSTRKAVPYAAVLYDTEGNTWTYVNPEPLVFVRHRITVDYIDGEVAVLSDGPATGSAVVIVGAEELYGSELEFEEE